MREVIDEYMIHRVLLQDTTAEEEIITLRKHTGHTFRLRKNIINWMT